MQRAQLEIWYDMIIFEVALCQNNLIILYVYNMKDTILEVLINWTLSMLHAVVQTTYWSVVVKLSQKVRLCFTGQSMFLPSRPSDSSTRWCVCWRPYSLWPMGWWLWVSFSRLPVTSAVREWQEDGGQLLSFKVPLLPFSKSALKSLICAH